MKLADICTVIIYRDNVTGTHDSDDNLMYLTVKTKILKQWFYKYIREYSPHKELSAEKQFDKWLTEYTADDTDGLFQFAKQRGGVLYIEN